ncbi:MAG: hypothetical protein ACT4PL_05235 [Phycisphaerales bacterium]
MRRFSFNHLLLGVVGIGALGAVGFAAVGWYLLPRRELDNDIAAWRTATERFEADALNAVAVRKRLQAFAETTLGRTEETVSADVRTALNEMAAAYGLRQTSVANLAPQSVRNPAAVATSDFKETWKRDLRESEDFRGMPATVSGKGSLEQCVSFLAALSAQDWAHRIDSVLLRPNNKDRTGFDLAVGLTTFFMTDLGRTAERTRLWNRPTDGESVAWRAIVEKNVFREPPAPAALPPATVTQAPPPPPAQGPAYGEWRVTAVVRGGSGPELWLLNTRTSEKKALSVGESVLDACFIGGSAGVARVTVGEVLFEVALNDTLAQRRAVPVRIEPAPGGGG